MKEHVKNGRLFMLLATIIIAGSLFTGGAAYAAGTELPVSGTYPDAGEGEEGQVKVDWILDQDGTLTLKKNDAKDKECQVVDVGDKAWGEHREQIKKIVFEEGIQEIGNSAFSGYETLTEISVPASVTEITYDAFSNCSSLTTVDLQKGLTSIGQDAFSNCVSLKTINIPNGVTDIGATAFSGCEKLTSIQLPATITTLEWSIFEDCASLSAITVNDGNPAYSDVKGVLYNKGKNTLICYPSGKAEDAFTVPETVTTIGEYGFRGCKLKTVTVSKGVTNIGYRAFFKCAQLKDITILSKTCVIEDDSETFDSIATIHGYAGSTAQAYAEKYVRAFEPIDSTGSNGSSGGAGDSGNTGNTGNNTQNTNDPAPVVKVTKITISGASHKVAVGKSITLKAAVSPSNAANKQVTWSSSDKKYVTVSDKGKVTAKKAGKTVTITAAAKDGSGKKATYKITPVKGKVKAIKISRKKTVKAGKSVKLTAKVSTTGKNANKALAWKSSNEKYATVDSKGKVKTKKAGKGKKVTITATATDGSNKKAKVIIKITK